MLFKIGFPNTAAVMFSFVSMVYQCNSINSKILGNIYSVALTKFLYIFSYLFESIFSARFPFGDIE